MDGGKTFDKIQHSFILRTLIKVDTCSVFLILCNPMNCSLPGSSVHMFQAIILVGLAISSSKSSWPKDQTYVSCSSCISKHILYLLTHQWSSHVDIDGAYLNIINTIMTNPQLTSYWKIKNWNPFLWNQKQDKVANFHHFYLAFLALNV